MFAIHFRRELILVIADFVITVVEVVLHVIVLETVTIRILEVLESVPEVDLTAILGQLVPNIVPSIIPVLDSDYFLVC